MQSGPSKLLEDIGAVSPSMVVLQKVNFVIYPVSKHLGEPFYLYLFQILTLKTFVKLIFCFSIGDLLKL